MKYITKNKGVLLFYVGLVICTQVYVWRVERLSEKADEYPQYVTLM
jgi:hypothetical protein